jgi:hypothetical protein
MTRTIDILRKAEKDARGQLESLKGQRAERYAELESMPTQALEAGATAVASLDVRIKAMQPRIEAAAAAVRTEEARLKSPDVIKAEQDAARIWGELEQDQKKIMRALAGQEPIVETMRTKWGDLLRAREDAGEDLTGVIVGYEPMACWIEALAGAFRNLRGAGVL